MATDVIINFFIREVAPVLLCGIAVGAAAGIRQTFLDLFAFPNL